MGSIADLEGIKMPTVSNLVHQLEQRGLIERSTDDNDGRSVIVHISARGRALFEQVCEEGAHAIRELVEQLPEEAQNHTEDFYDVLLEMCTVLEKQSRVSPASTQIPSSKVNINQQQNSG